MSRQLRKGVEMLDETIGSGARIERQKYYQISLRCWLNQGDPVRWAAPWGLVDRYQLLEEGELLLTDIRFDRESLIAGLFYGIEGMRIGGCRRLKIAPHLAYGESGVEGSIPQNAVLTCHIEILEERRFE